MVWNEQGLLLASHRRYDRATANVTRSGKEVIDLKKVSQARVGAWLGA